MTLDEARLMASVNARAQRLFADGYRARWVAPGLLAVRNGRGATYGVDTAAGTCGCAFFRGHDGRHPCKHLLGWERLLAEQRARTRRLTLMLAALLRVWVEVDDGSPLLDDGSSGLDDAAPGAEAAWPAPDGLPGRGADDAGGAHSG